MFDSLLLLAGGHTVSVNCYSFEYLYLFLNKMGEKVYFGPADNTSQYFRDIGFPVPADYNVADYLSKHMTSYYHALFSLVTNLTHN